MSTATQTNVLLYGSLHLELPYILNFNNSFTMLMSYRICDVGLDTSVWYNAWNSWWSKHYCKSGTVLRFQQVSPVFVWCTVFLLWVDCILSLCFSCSTSKRVQSATHVHKIIIMYIFLWYYYKVVWWCFMWAIQSI